eukprot:XP_016657225.1 PREDICTED: uncharacterized protein LOC103308320 [Acyrthosiphon pisum]
MSKRGSDIQYKKTFKGRTLNLRCLNSGQHDRIVQYTLHVHRRPQQQPALRMPNADFAYYRIVYRQPRAR